LSPRAIGGGGKVNICHRDAETKRFPIRKAGKQEIVLVTITTDRRLQSGF
jgi:hypothetical protein